MSEYLITDLRKLNKRQNGLKIRHRESQFVTPFWKEGNKPLGVLCCQFYEAKWSNGCMYECDYCYLKGTFRWQKWKGREQTIFSNVDKLFEEVENFLKLDAPMILHTGEVADSLAVPGSEEIMSKLVERFGKQDKHTLLLLTKSTNINKLLDVLHNRMTVIGFSINPPSVAKSFEKGAATTEERLRAVRKCVDAGYKVMVRVDPMIPVRGWRRQYVSLFHKLNNLDLFGVVVGTLRAFSGLKPMMSRELKEMLQVRGNDRRWHLEQELRNEMYSTAFKTLTSSRIGLCKESGEMWARLGKSHGFRKFICNCHLQE